MLEAQESKIKLLRQFQNFEISCKKPVYTFHRYQIYKLKISGDTFKRGDSEIAFFAKNRDESEKCIIYCSLGSRNEVEGVRYWRSVDMDSEMCYLLLQGFLREYLNKHFFIPLE